MKITSVIISICLCICCLYDSLASDAVISLPPLSPGEASVCISKADGAVRAVIGGVGPGPYYS